MPRSLRPAAALLLAVSLASAVVAVRPALSQTASPTPKAGGTLKIMTREDTPQGFAVHESATISTVWPSSPCFNNLVYFDPLKGKESADTIIGELAEKWSWQDNYRNLVFFLRRDVKWHDGKPFTSKDVKFTFDMVREASGAEGKIRLNPRKDWYANVDAVEAPDAYTSCSGSSGRSPRCS
jgi:peptide/nickel transport system substrate-binding protein